MTAGVNVMLLSSEEKAELFQDARGKKLLLQAPRLFTAALMRRLMHHGFTREHVLRELYRVFGEDMALTIYCNPVAMLSLSVSLRLSAESSASSSIITAGITVCMSKEDVRYLLRCLRTVAVGSSSVSVRADDESEFSSVAVLMAKEFCVL